jgi:uncharacterized membrane protein
MRAELIRPTPVTTTAAVAILMAIAFSLAFLLARFESLPVLLPVHFGPDGLPDGWQFKTYPRVLLPFFIQTALSFTFGAIGILLLQRPYGSRDSDASDVRAASAAVEGIALISLIWVVFQTYAAYALARMWQRGRAGLGPLYGILEVVGLALTVLVAVRARARLGRPAPQVFVPEHWHGQLYLNRADPALFVPTRNGVHWTINFGRPVATVLIVVLVVMGVLGPTVILSLLLR